MIRLRIVFVYCNILSHIIIVNAINKLRLPVPICTEMTQSSDVQGNINKIIIVEVKFILMFTIFLSTGI